MTMTDDAAFDVGLWELEHRRDVARRVYEQAVEAARAAKVAEATALDDWSRARIAYARAKGHPLAGKTLQRTYVQGTYTGKRNRTITGTVKLWEGLRTAYGMRHHCPIPGEWYIASDSGKTGYTLENNAVERHGWKVVDDDR